MNNKVWLYIPFLAAYFVVGLFSWIFKWNELKTEEGLLLFSVIIIMSFIQALYNMLAKHDDYIEEEIERLNDKIKALENPHHQH